ncbi:MAG: hypothetical protein ACLRSW_17015, partial [Christensenellaceae bacterium]
VVEEETESETRVKLVRKRDGVNEEYFECVINRLEEILLGVTINKSILCSLYHAKDLELNGKPASGGMFDNGSYGDTPDYLGAYEARAMNTEVRKHATTDYI